jgi:glycosyltransferase involved in cell wall biosynthesis
LRLLYVALDQTVPGTLGGSIHVDAVARGLAALGHDVHVATQRGTGAVATTVTWHDMQPSFGIPQLRWLRTGAVESLAREIRADAIMERYYNFGGEGVLAARRVGIPSALEVNAPVIDHPGSTKSKVDRALLIEPMRRWRDRLCRLTDLFITPSADILPEFVSRRKVLEIEWGADVESFSPDATGTLPFVRDPERILCVFAGAFRPWHGAVQLASAMARLQASGERRFGAVFIGDGPERAAVEQVAQNVPGVIFTGAIAHALMPACLAAADIGVAPFDETRHPPLQLGFYWSPLKVFEYMASGLPVVAPRLPRLKHLVKHDEEGLLYDPADFDGLVRSLRALVDPDVRRRLGVAARARVVRDFSWEAHCRALDARLRALLTV